MATPTVVNIGGEFTGAGARTIAGGADAFLPTSAGDRVNGRATAATVMTVVGQGYGVAAQNTPGALAGDLQRIDALVASLNKS